MREGRLRAGQGGSWEDLGKGVNRSEKDQEGAREQGTRRERRREEQSEGQTRRS